MMLTDPQCERRRVPGRALFLRLNSPLMIWPSVYF